MNLNSKSKVYNPFNFVYVKNKIRVVLLGRTDKNSQLKKVIIYFFKLLLLNTDSGIVGLISSFLTIKSVPLPSFNISL